LPSRITVNTIVIHPTHYALAVSDDADSTRSAEGAVHRPSPTTGAGDRLNAGFCANDSSADLALGDFIGVLVTTSDGGSDDQRNRQLLRDLAA
jgi:hypothetical protein